jgi:type IV pilus assembly protein PilV
MIRSLAGSSGRASCPVGEAGISLIEMLIALLVLSFGLLGVAGLQAHSLKNNQSAYLRTQANILAYEITDRMRANRNAALDGAYNYQADDIEDPDPDVDPCTGTRACDDLTAWNANLEQFLPAAAGAVECNVVAPAVCRVTVEWDDTRGSSSVPARIMVSTEI